MWSKSPKFFLLFSFIFTLVSPMRIRRAPIGTNPLDNHVEFGRYQNQDEEEELQYPTFDEDNANNYPKAPQNNYQSNYPNNYDSSNYNSYPSNYNNNYYGQNSNYNNNNYNSYDNYNGNKNNYYPNNKNNHLYPNGISSNGYGGYWQGAGGNYDHGNEGLLGKLGGLLNMFN